jgi:hypothetical protein
MVPKVTAMLSHERKVLSLAKNVFGSTLPMLLLAPLSVVSRKYNNIDNI